MPIVVLHHESGAVPDWTNDLATDEQVEVFVAAWAPYGWSRADAPAEPVPPAAAAAPEVPASPAPSVPAPAGNPAPEGV